MPTYKCAICERDVEYAGRVPDLYPFCSPRCKYVDLGKWLREGYAIDRDLSAEELERLPPPVPPHKPGPED
ncbi:MAG: DNA gyrase inhibitor YacG [Planctomycetota bacterium]